MNVVASHFVPALSPWNHICDFCLSRFSNFVYFLEMDFRDMCLLCLAYLALLALTIL